VIALAAQAYTNLNLEFLIIVPGVELCEESLRLADILSAYSWLFQRNFGVVSVLPTLLPLIPWSIERAPIHHGFGQSDPFDRVEDRG